MNKTIQNKLVELSEEKYREFSQKLVTGGMPLVGVRLPVLRKFAKDIVNGKYNTGYENWEEILDDKASSDKYFEEVMLRGMLTGFGTSKEKNIIKAEERLDKFVPLVDNWSVCDSFCVSFTITEQYRQEIFDHIQRYLYSDKEFEVRVGLIILLDYFIKVDKTGKKISRKRIVEMTDIKTHSTEKGMYIDRILKICNREFNQGYYASMAAAWLIAECFTVYPYDTFEFIKSNNMDKITLNKAIQKICESRIPDENVKRYIRNFKIK